MRIVLIVFVVLAALGAPLGWYIAIEATRPPPPPPPEVTAAEIAALRAELEILSTRVGGLEARLSRTETRPSVRLPAPAPGQPEEAAEDYAEVVLIADRRDVNEGLTHATPAFLEELFGLPRQDLGDSCVEMTNLFLLDMLVHEDVGPINVRMLRPAINSLRQVFRNVQVFEPGLYAQIQGSGSLCVRRVRGADSTASAHAYGLAVDINIGGNLDTLGDGKTQLGLLLMAAFFRREDWYWGAGFRREDSMHFEVSRELLEKWVRLGVIPPKPEILYKNDPATALDVPGDTETEAQQQP
ncbi:MAG: M15 family metallopeptidase [Pseudomonadota bacterium]